MDKIDVVLFKFKMERTVSKEYKKMTRILLILITMPLLIDLSFLFVFPAGYALCCILHMVLMLILDKFWEGKWGTNKWKHNWMKIYKENFQLYKRTLVEVIKEEKLNCQQVYNILIKKHSRILPWTNKESLIIAIFSLVISLIGILVQLLQKESLESYAKLVQYISLTIIVLGIVAYIFYRVISMQNGQSDEKKKEYEYIIKLLEDYLY